MRGVVVYFSLSGNTRKIAKAIHRGMKKVLEADIAQIKEISPKQLAKYDLVGFGSPVWFQREPANVSLFLYKMPDMSGKLFFLFATHGTLPLGLFMRLAQLIQRKNGQIIGWMDWFAQSNSVCHIPYPSPAHGHPDMVDLVEAEVFGREMAERALQVISGRRDLIPSIPKGDDAPSLFKPHPLVEPFPGVRPTRMINKERCKYPSCTLCQDLCLAGVIDLSKDSPCKPGCWNESLCNRICPYNAIEMEPEEMAMNLRSQYKIDLSKCVYPECRLCVENCPMDSIDFATKPPSFKYNCEGCDFLKKFKIAEKVL
ncbi:MAG: flavodoxin family protein [Candidatus Bathyarchaeia archaeon]